MLFPKDFLNLFGIKYFIFNPFLIYLLGDRKENVAFTSRIFLGNRHVRLDSLHGTIVKSINVLFGLWLNLDLHIKVNNINWLDINTLRYTRSTDVKVYFQFVNS